MPAIGNRRYERVDSGGNSAEAAVAAAAAAAAAMKEALNAGGGGGAPPVRQATAVGLGPVSPPASPSLCPVVLTGQLT
jgi:hypothetical protein